jgi:ankyrin repeat protein
MIVKMLLEAGVDPFSPKTRENYREGLARRGPKTTGETAVQYICRQGHTKTLMVMLPFLRPEMLEEILCESCRYGKFENVRAVLENSTVSSNSKFTGTTALYLACRAHSMQCVELLLQKGVDVHLIST